MADNMYRFSRCSRWFACISLLFFLGSSLLAGPGDVLYNEAKRQFQLKNYRDARLKYEELIQKVPTHPKLREAVNQVIACHLRMGEFAKALDFAKARIGKDKGTIWEARSHRRYANLLMAAPHWGTRRAGKFHRGRHMQGEYVNSFRKDRKEAIRHLETARSVYFQFINNKAKFTALPKNEQSKLLSEALNCNFDLAGAILRRREYAQSWDWWDDFDEQDVEIEEYEPGRGYTRYQVRGSMPPAGLKVDKDGNPIFTKTPKAYKIDLPDDQKVRYLLKEIEAKDPTPNHELKALAMYRRAMIARARFGPDLVRRWWQYGHRRFGPLGMPLENDPNKPEKELWELKDNEALTWVSGELRVVKLPPEEDIVAILSDVGHEYSNTEIADDALFAMAAFFQTRQQYPRALEVYQELLGAFPNTPLKGQAENARKKITARQVQLHQVGAQLAGQKAKLQVSYRNASNIQFTIQPIDLPGFIKRIEELNGKTWNYRQKEINGLPPNARQMTNPWGLTSFLLDPRYNRYQKLLRGKPMVWSAKVENDGSMRPAQTILETPIDKPGTYFVEARVEGGKQSSRTFFIVSNLAILVKKISGGKNLYYLADADTGAPISNADFTIYEVWTEGRRAGRTWQQVNHVIKHTARTNDAGLYEFSLPNPRSRQIFAVADLRAKAADQAGAQQTRFAFTQMTYWSFYNPIWRRDNRTRIYVVTDRPVYRPNNTVRFKVWVRRKLNGKYVDSAGLPLHIEIRDARNNKIAEYNWKADANGSVDGKVELGEEPPLGQYRISVQWREGHRTYAWGNARFRVEEYKKPEFEVTVKPGATYSKLGQTITAVIQAKYYFGAPVTEATVNYKVFRQAFRHNYIPPGPYDWLYGPGYGIIDYPYEWLPWWKRWGWGCIRIPPPWYSWGMPAAKELVKHGEAPIGKDGKLEIKIDTAKAYEFHGDSDHRYFIQAEVTDSSRRTITGSGGVSATRQSFYAYVNINRGWLRPGDQATVEVRALTPDNTPVATKGKLVISEVKYRGRRNDEVIEKINKEFDIETDANGLATLPLRLERSGQFRICFKAKDPWGGEVQGNAVLWVAGDDFDGKLYRFNSLEVLTDKRDYKVGDVAHVLINVAEPDSYVIFSSDALNGVLRNYRLIHIPNKSKVVDITIQQRYEPNFFIEATTIRGGRVHQTQRELAVPTRRHFLDVTITPDKPQYGPGQSGALSLQVKDHNGVPVQTALTLAAFDSSVLYIQPEMFPKVESFFHGQKRSHHMRAIHSLAVSFNSRGGGVYNPNCPPGTPQDWLGFWGPPNLYWQEISLDQVAMLGGGHLAVAKRGPRMLRETAPGKMARRAAEAEGLAMDAVAAPAAIMGDRALGFAGAPARPREKAAGLGRAQPDAFVEAKVRSFFADTALWQPTVPTDAQGKASVPITFPESLTTWKINAWAISRLAKVGFGTTSVITTKNLIVRLQAPRFFVERDEVTLSANVHNYLATAKKVKVELAIPARLLASHDPLVKMVDVPAKGEKRVDWHVQVLREGTAEITVKALTNEESDAMQLAFPVFVHGMEVQVTNVGSIPADKVEGASRFAFTIPQKINPEATRLTVRIAPSLAGAILDALPYLFDYEYDTVESTLSRFLPAIVVKRTLKETGMDLESIEEKRRDLARPAVGHRYGYWTNPVFNTSRLNSIVKTCLQRILNWQHNDGGWGWWSSSRSSVYQTCYVLYCLNLARKAGLDIPQRVIDRGMNYVQNNLESECGWFIKKNKDGKPIYRFRTSHAYAVYVLSLGKRRKDNWTDLMYEKRDRLNNYGKALLCLTYYNLGNMDRAKILLQNIEQYMKQDDENETAWIDTPVMNRGWGWWYWYNNDIETNAWILQCFAALQPKSEKSRRLVKWLLNNRRHGHYWHSTRDTAIAVNAFAEYMRASGELEPDYELTVSVDNGALGKKVFRVNARNMFFFDNLFTLSGEEIGPGKHTIQVTKKGKGAAYISTIAIYFSREEDIKGEGLDLRVKRQYYRLVPKAKTVKVTTTQGEKVAEKFASYERVPMSPGDEVASGDLIEVEMLIQAKNDYDYLVFEDMKPAGCEPLDIRSGSRAQEGLWAHMELRDEKVAFFIQLLRQGEHRVRYRLRAEIPGHFHALPTKGYGMYVPDLYGTSDEMRVKIKDKP